MEALAAEEGASPLFLRLLVVSGPSADGMTRPLHGEGDPSQSTDSSSSPLLETPHRHAEIMFPALWASVCPIELTRTITHYTATPQPLVITLLPPSRWCREGGKGDPPSHPSVKVVDGGRESQMGERRGQGRDPGLQLLIVGSQCLTQGPRLLSGDILGATTTRQVHPLWPFSHPCKFAVINYYPVSGTSLIFIIAHLHNSSACKRDKRQSREVRNSRRVT